MISRENNSHLQRDLQCFHTVIWKSLSDTQNGVQSNDIRNLFLFNRTFLKNKLSMLKCPKCLISILVFRNYEDRRSSF